LNFTLALLGGLVVIAPGLTALALWQLRSGQDGARRSELPLTSVTALFVVLGTSLLAHLLGYGLIEAMRGAGTELGAYAAPPFRTQLQPNPYDAIIRLAEADRGGKATPGDLLLFGYAVLGECLLAGALVASRGLSISMSGLDIGNQGWVFQNIVKPTRYGMKPIAYVLTVPIGGETGLGYRGVVVEARLGADGELKGLTLADPDAFGYEVAAPAHEGADFRISNSSRRALRGILNLEAAAIRNVLIETVPDDLLTDIDAAISTADLSSEPSPVGEAA
jgi:hypothetical protein